MSRFIGILEVVSRAFKDSTPIWKDENFPCRLRVKIVIALTPETAVPIPEFKERLSIFRDLKHPFAWTGHVRGSPAKWKVADGQAVVAALEEAKRNPIERPVDRRKLEKHFQPVKTPIGPVIIPGGEETAIEGIVTRAETTEHARIQWELLRLGCDMGLDVWVARNDKGKEVDGHKFGDLPRLKSQLPLQFDEATTRTIELIDVLWLMGKAIVAAFEIESTTSIYSGLLRLSDLIAMQPNLNIPLYLVAPDERREKVISELNRPTFSRLSPPLAEMCRFISFSALRQGLVDVAHVVHHVKPEFIEDLSESCEVEEI